jgi:hypothetical protein
VKIAGKETDPVSRARFISISTENEHIPRSWSHQTEHAAKCRRFSGAVRAEVPEDFARFDTEADST